MQQDKFTNKPKELEMIISDSVKTSDALTDVMEQFNIKKVVETFNNIKRNGILVSKILTIMLIMPFFKVASIRAMFKSGIGTKEIEGKKDVYYDIKNNEKVNWRSLLLLIAIRFNYLIKQREELNTKGVKAIIFDDTPVEKTSKKTENVSLLHDHVTGRFILGYKLLVCGYWDGGSFIPLDFSLHREKGQMFDKALHSLKKVETALQQAQENLDHSKNRYAVKTQKYNERLKIATDCSGKTNQYYLNCAEKAKLKAKAELKEAQKEVTNKTNQVSVQRENVKETERKHPSYGLNKKAKKEQFKKKRTKGSYGYERCEETDTDKIENSLSMLRRVIKVGFMPDYVLTDSWFFCFKLLNMLTNLAKGQIKLISMAKMDSRKYSLPKNGKEYNSKALLTIHKRSAKNCRKLKSQYIKIPCLYQGIRVNLFFVRMGRNDNWKLLITNDINLNFTRLIEIYHIRWSIEVFFKEGKQFLNIGHSLSQDFDAQIADTTLSMIQHIMLSYYKRINYQQSFGFLFKEISSQMIEKSLTERMWILFLELQLLIGDIAGFDVLELYQELFKRKETSELIERILLPNYNLKKVA